MSLQKLYRGFVRTDDKKASKEKVKDVPDDKLRTLDRCKGLNNYAGVLTETSIMIDVDEREPAECVFKIIKSEGICCRVTRTNRGMHFTFRKYKPLTKREQDKVTSAIGVKIDYKWGDSLYEILKHQGVERECIYDKTIEGRGDYDDVPKWLLPVKTKISVYDLDDGDGRNDTLFRYAMALYSANRFTVNEIRETFRIINNYVFKTPLDEQELKVILRDGAFDSLPLPSVYRDDNGKVNIPGMAEQIVKDHSLVWFEGNLIGMDELNKRNYISPEELNRFARKIDANITKRDNAEIRDWIIGNAPLTQPLDGTKYVCFNNGVYDIDTRHICSLGTGSYELVNIVHANYIPDMHPVKYVDDAVSSWLLGDKELITLFWQMVGSMMYSGGVLGEKAFVLKGTGSNGKSTCFRMLTNFIGEENNTSVSLNDMGKDYSSISFYRKLTNICGELSYLDVDDSRTFKMLTGGDRIRGREIYQKGQEFISYATPIYGTNKFPSIGDKTYAMRRRICVIPFDACFKDTDKDPALKDKLCSEEARSYIAWRGLQGLHEVLDNHGNFMTAKRSEEQYELWERETNIPYAFGLTRNRKNIAGHTLSEVMTQFQCYCSETGHTKAGRTYTAETIRDILCERLNFSTIVTTDDVGNTIERFVDVRNSD